MGDRIQSVTPDHKIILEANREVLDISLDGINLTTIHVADLWDMIRDHLAGLNSSDFETQRREKEAIAATVSMKEDNP